MSVSASHRSSKSRRSSIFSPRRDDDPGHAVRGAMSRRRAARRTVRGGCFGPAFLGESMMKGCTVHTLAVALAALVCAVGPASALPHGRGVGGGRGQHNSEAFCSGEKAGLMLRGAAGNFLIGGLAEALSHGITYPLGSLALASHSEGGIDTLLKV